MAMGRNRVFWPPTRIPGPPGSQPASLPDAAKVEPRFRGAKRDREPGLH